MQRIFDFLRSDDIPYVARATYLQERAHLIIWSLVLGTIEANLAGVVVTKTFHASKLLTTVVWGLPVVMMMLNVLWGLIIRGRPRKLVLFILTIVAALLTGSIAFATPEWHPWGGWVFAGQIGLIHFFVSGLVTLRSSMWQVNYPESIRGRIIGRIQTIRFLFVPLSAAVVSAQFDLDPSHYCIVYPAVAGLGLLSLVPMRRFRVRRERSEIKEYRAHRVKLRESGGASTGLWGGVKEAGGILRRHHEFRRYMLAQFSLGSANFFTDPMLLVVITMRLDFDYLTSIMVMAVIPGMCSWLAIRFWAPYFDKVGVVRFRVANCYVWISSYICVAAAMLIIESGASEYFGLAIGIIVAGRVLKGVAHGGGIIAWSIGHLHFARKNQVDLYMSIHVAFTGVRALTMPYLSLLANTLLGNSSFLIAIGLSGTATYLFRKLASGDAGGETEPRA